MGDSLVKLAADITVLGKKNPASIRVQSRKKNPPTMTVCGRRMAQPMGSICTKMLKYVEKKGDVRRRLTIVFE